MSVQFQIGSGAPAEQEVDALIVTVGKNQALTEADQSIDASLNGALTQALGDIGFQGTVGKAAVIPTLGRLPARRIVVTGTGEAGTQTLNSISRAWGVAARTAREAGARTIAGSAPVLDGVSPEETHRAAVEGVVLATYRFLEYRTQNLPTGTIESVTFLNSQDGAADGIETGERRAAAVALARDLGNRTPDLLYPAEFARIAQETADALGMECTVYDEDGLRELGAGALLAVGQGSSRGPRLIHLVSKPKGESKGTIAFVGKAITFDTGGLNLKPAEGMSTMKIDMAGGGAVMGAMSAVPLLDLPFTVHGIIASAENMPSATSFRPQDVLRSMNGKTIEITNTDAEGRLVLADALTYAVRQQVDLMINLATLTGAARVALGTLGAAAFYSDEELVHELQAAGEANGERLWPMPMWDEYRHLLDSDTADLKNSGGRAGGAIFGAMFLKEFTEGLPWVHLDIAGPAWGEVVSDLAGRGATGYGVRTLLSFLQNRASN